jgi:hypothetical protein
VRRTQNKDEIREIGISEPKQGAAVVARFARNVFDMADTADRSNTADAQTVKTFMAAVCFLDTVNYFRTDLGDAGAALLTEVEIKRKHAAYRASVIAKALKAGTAVPPPKGESGDAGMDDLDLDSMFASLPPPPGSGGGAAGGGAGGYGGVAAGGLGLPPPALAPARYMPPAPAPAPAPAAPSPCSQPQTEIAMGDLPAIPQVSRASHSVSPSLRHYVSRPPSCIPCLTDASWPRAGRPQGSSR